MPDEDSPENAHRLPHHALTRRFRSMGGEDDIVDQGGVFALVGPTGVGKTTTTAKLAGPLRVRHGADKLALITTDSYRIGAHEQLCIYGGRILGVLCMWCATPPSCAKPGQPARQVHGAHRTRWAGASATRWWPSRARCSPVRAAVAPVAAQLRRGDTSTTT